MGKFILILYTLIVAPFKLVVYTKHLSKHTYLYCIVLEKYIFPVQLCFVGPPCYCIDCTATTVPPSTATHLICAEGFNSSNGSCYPSCRHWNQDGPAWATATTVILLLSASLAVLSSIVLFVVSFIRYRSMYVLTHMTHPSTCMRSVLLQVQISLHLPCLYDIGILCCW